MTRPVVGLRLACSARALQIPKPVIGEPAIRIGHLEAGVETEGFRKSRNRLLISASRIQRPAERGIASASERVEHDGAAGGGKGGVEVPLSLIHILLKVVRALGLKLHASVA